MTLCFMIVVLRAITQHDSYISTFPYRVNTPVVSRVMDFIEGIL